MSNAYTLSLARGTVIERAVLMARTLWLIPATFVTLTLCVVLMALCTAATLGKAQNLIIHVFSLAIGRLVLTYAGIKLRIEHVGEKINRPAIYIANHSSTLDLFVILALGLPRVRYVAKHEFIYNPFFGLMGKMTGQIFIKRQDSEAAIATLNQAYDRLRRERLSLLFMPEGTRRVDGKIGPFKKGAFRMAMDLNCPIVPMHFIGTRRLCPGKSHVVHPGTITVRFHPAIDMRSWNSENLDANVSELRERYIRWEQEAATVEVRRS